MGSIFHKTLTRPLSPKMEIIGRGKKRKARWRGNGEWLESPVVVRADKTEHVRVKTTTYYAKYRDGDGRVKVVATGCKDRRSAEQFLGRLERDADRVKSGIATSDEIRQAKHKTGPIEDHVLAYLGTFRGSEAHRKDTGRCLARLIQEFHWGSLADMRRDELETWLASETRSGRSARSRNAHHTALVSFCNWCVMVKRLAANPFVKIAKAGLEADPRRPRRALFEQEVARLVQAARNAPRRPGESRRGKPSEASRRPAERLPGPDRAELYLVLVGTGLRKGELSKLVVKDLRLYDRIPCIELPAAIDKKHRQAVIPLRHDLVELLAERVKDLAPTDHVFEVPADLIKRFDADCRRAGIPKRDDRGRTVDLHSLRMTFNTWLAKAGVAPRIAQELMRHEDIDLTMNVYTDPALFDLVTAVESLPSLLQMLYRSDVFKVQPMSSDVNVEADRKGKSEAS